MDLDTVMTNRLTGGAGNDTLQATAFVDNFERSGSALNILLAGDGNDSLTATILAGTPGANRLFGHAGNDRLQVNGGTGNLLNAGAGTDVLISGAGVDTLVGGSGNDIFRFLSTASSTPVRARHAASRRRHGGFERPGGQPGDRIDLSAIDANTRAEARSTFVFGNFARRRPALGGQLGRRDPHPRQHRCRRRPGVRNRHPGRRRAGLRLHQRGLPGLTLPLDSHAIRSDARRSSGHRLHLA